MKRVLAILLIVVHLMNTIGNYGVAAKLAALHEAAVSDQLDADQYAGSNAITLRIPFSLPYSTDTYERAVGKIEYEGEAYHMVKHKFHNDTLFIVCLKDSKLTKINGTLKDLAAAMGDSPDTKHSNKSSLVMLVKDFEDCASFCLNHSLFQLRSVHFPEYSFSAIINSESPLDQPPRA